MQHKHLPHDHGHVLPELEHEIRDGNTFLAISDVFRMMSDEKRARMFWLLCHTEECVINISALLDMSSPAASHHLKQLKKEGLIISRREGKEVYYTAAKTPRAEALHHAIEHMIEISCPADTHDHATDFYDSQIGIISAIHDLITENIAKRYTIDYLSASFHINPTTLKSVFKQVYGKPIGAYMKELRMRRAAELLRHTSAPISEIATSVGYESASKFTVAFKETTGMLPKQYRKS